MDNRPANSSPNPEDTGAKAEWYVLLYSCGALLGLVSAFHPSLSALQTTNCLVLSWMLALGALLVSLVTEEKDEDTELDHTSDDW